MTKRYSLTMMRLLMAARSPLTPIGKNAWRAGRYPVVRNPSNTGMVTLTKTVVFSGATALRLQDDGLLKHRRRGGIHDRLLLTPKGKKARGRLPRMCIACGCTDMMACREGCSWVGPDLCSACIAGQL